MSHIPTLVQVNGAIGTIMTRFKRPVRDLRIPTIAVICRIVPRWPIWPFCGPLAGHRATGTFTSCTHHHKRPSYDVTEIDRVRPAAAAPTMERASFRLVVNGCFL